MRSFIGAILILITLQASGQRVLVSATGEMTVAGYEGGGVISIEGKSAWKVGVFYQKSLFLQKEYETSTNAFWGMITCVPLAKSEKVNFHGVVRAGFANEIFFVVTPGFETTVRLGNNLSFGAGLSIRKTYPSASMKINFVL